MIKKVERFMRENKMTAPGDSLIVGVSGGADSVCLLYILRSLRKTLDIELTPAERDYLDLVSDSLD